MSSVCLHVPCTHFRFGIRRCWLHLREAVQKHAFSSEAERKLPFVPLLISESDRGLGLCTQAGQKRGLQSGDRPVRNGSWVSPPMSDKRRRYVVAPIEHFRGRRTIKWQLGRSRSRPAEPIIGELVERFSLKFENSPTFCQL